jgi:NADH:ubiquinone oxidoreductase subunit E
MKSILVCTNHRMNPNQPSCGARGAIELKQAITDAVEKQDVNIAVKEIQCLGECEAGPNARLIPGGPIFRHLKHDDVSQLIQAAKAFAKD